jgi:hypothetical protein
MNFLVPSSAKNIFWSEEHDISAGAPSGQLPPESSQPASAAVLISDGQFCVSYQIQAVTEITSKTNLCSAKSIQLFNAGWSGLGEIKWIFQLMQKCFVQTGRSVVMSPVY